jgi:hypothetical protein
MDISVCDDSLLAPVVLNLSASSPAGGDPEKEEEVIDEIIDIDIPDDYKIYTEEIEQQAQEMLDEGQLDTKAREYAEGGI